MKGQIAVNQGRSKVKEVLKDIAAIICGFLIVICAFILIFDIIIVFARHEGWWRMLYLAFSVISPPVAFFFI